jgi:Ca2+-binding EF-hand superfamily protein
MEQAGYMTTNIFGQLDENHDGRISQKEFMEVAKALKMMEEETSDEEVDDLH